MSSQWEVENVCVCVCETSGPLKWDVEIAVMCVEHVANNQTCKSGGGGSCGILN